MTTKHERLTEACRDFVSKQTHTTLLATRSIRLVGDIIQTRMARGPIYEWQGTEYAFEEKGADWYWALGIIATAAIVACILFNNIILALVVAAGAFAAALQAAKHPRMHRFAIYEQGVGIDDRMYVYEDMIDFSVLEYADESLPPSLSIKTKHFLAPHLLIPIVGHDPVEIYEFFLERVLEGRHDESVVDRFVDMLRL